MSRLNAIAADSPKILCSTKAGSEYTQTLGRKEKQMPIVHISMIAGRPPEKKERLIKKVTDAIVEALEVSADRVHIILHDIPKENIGDGGVPLSKKNP